MSILFLQAKIYHTGRRNQVRDDGDVNTQSLFTQFSERKDMEANAFLESACKDGMPS
jgi:hypothetical protein